MLYCKAGVVNTENFCEDAIAACFNKKFHKLQLGGAVLCVQECSVVVLSRICCEKATSLWESSLQFGSEALPRAGVAALIRSCLALEENDALQFKNHYLFSAIML